MTVREITNYLTGEGRVNAAKLLELADSYMMSYNRMPESFVLPHKHAALKPLIDQYARSLSGWVLYVQGVRDTFERGSDEYAAVHEFYRRINVRYLQHSRRERLNRAYDKAAELWGPIAFSDRQQWFHKLEHTWARRRLAYMESVRKGAGIKRLTDDERRDVLDEFWALIDQEIDEGKLPRWK